MEIPESFKELIGTEIQYKKKGVVVCTGIVENARFGASQIMTNTLERFYSIQLRIRPTCGFNKNRPIWTTGFNSGIKINENE